MIDLKILPEFKKTISQQGLIQAAQAVLHHQSVLDADLTLVLTGDAQIQALNHDYLAIDAPTDVLSFPSSQTDPDSGLRYLGDIIISIPSAKANASMREHSLEAELTLLVVHGMLHLFGYDHAEPEEKRLMWEAQAVILVSLGISPTIVHE